MPAVSKSSGKYFWEKPRVWLEAIENGAAPFYVGQWKGTYKLPQSPTPDAFRDLAEGHKVLRRVQANRVGCFDLTFTFHKSVSILAYGLTPPDKQHQWTKAFVDVTRPGVERLLSGLQVSAGGKRVAAQGVGVGFAHRQSWLGEPQAHVHYAVPNVAVGPDGTAKSIRNALGFFEAQTVERARAQKEFDQSLQNAGYRTKREGNMVALAGMPREMVEELSPARAAMNAARQAKGFSGPKAHDFYARQARRDAGPRIEVRPDDMYRECRRVAKTHGVTVDSLKDRSGKPPAIQDRNTRTYVAYDVARTARDECVRRYGTFSESQYRERLYTLAIGLPTTVKELDREAERVLSRPKEAGVRKVVSRDGEVRYTTARGAKASVRAERPYVREAWTEFTAAAKDLGAATLTATAQAATRVVKRLKDAVSPPPRVVKVDAARLDRFLARHEPTPYLLAHGKALLRGFLSLGNPHHMAGRAETEFAKLRAHRRLEKNTVVVVTRGNLASARDLHRLAKIAKRDGSSVILAERPKGRGGPGGRGQSQSQNHRHQQQPNPSRGRNRDRD